MNLSGKAVQYSMDKEKIAQRKRFGDYRRFELALRNHPHETQRQRWRAQRVEKHSVGFKFQPTIRVFASGISDDFKKGRQVD